MTKVALISGVTGVVGRRLALHLAALPDWRVIGFARRAAAADLPGVEVHSVDLTSRDAIRAAIARCAGISHIFHCARYDHSTDRPEPVDINTAMLVELVEAVEDAGHPLAHVHLVQGSKYYGSNLGRYRTPAREDHPRSLQSNFYFEQEDYCIARQGRRRWTWSASRPHAICDRAPGIARSLPMVIAVYAAISKELGLPLCFPGTVANFHAIYQCTDAQHLAKAITWMATTPACANQAFNITNGDFIRWEHLWPGFARGFGMEFGGVLTTPLGKVMADKGAVWDRIVRKYDLVPTRFEQVALWPYADFIFTPHWDMMSDTSKARRFGFPDVVDTEAMFHDMWAGFRAARIIPPS